MTNPFAPPSSVTLERGVFGGARQKRSGFLYRVIDIDSPVQTQLVYSGWWFRQKLELDGLLVWFRISWLTITRQADFRLPASIDPDQSPGKLEIEFGRGLAIRRFRVWIQDQLIYDEIN